MLWGGGCKWEILGVSSEDRGGNQDKRRRYRGARKGGRAAEEDLPDAEEIDLPLK